MERKTFWKPLAILGIAVGGALHQARPVEAQAVIDPACISDLQTLSLEKRQIIIDGYEGPLGASVTRDILRQEYYLGADSMCGTGTDQIQYSEIEDALKYDQPGYVQLPPTPTVVVPSSSVMAPSSPGTTGAGSCSDAIRDMPDKGLQDTLANFAQPETAFFPEEYLVSQFGLSPCDDGDSDHNEVISREVVINAIGLPPVPTTIPEQTMDIQPQVEVAPENNVVEDNADSAIGTESTNTGTPSTDLPPISPVAGGLTVLVGILIAGVVVWLKRDSVRSSVNGSQEENLGVGDAANKSENIIDDYRGDQDVVYHQGDPTEHTTRHDREGRRYYREEPDHSDPNPNAGSGLGSYTPAPDTSNYISLTKSRRGSPGRLTLQANKEQLYEQADAYVGHGDVGDSISIHTTEGEVGRIIRKSGPPQKPIQDARIRRWMEGFGFPPMGKNDPIRWPDDDESLADHD